MPRKKAETPPPIDGRSLVTEIEDLTRLLAEQERSGRDADKRGNTETLVMVRLAPGLSADQWKRMVEKAPALSRWITVPLDGDSYPLLNHLQERINKLSYLTEHDPLTGLLNRRGFEHVLESEMKRARREGFHLSLVIIDLDDFKQVNDTYGHPCGDLVLEQLARDLEANKRGYDQAARLGGEEFALLLPSAGPNKAQVITRRLLDGFSRVRFSCNDQEPFSVTFSAGLSFIKGKTRVTPLELIALADEALYQAKAKGKQTIVVSRDPDKGKRPKQTMVHSDEKRFLFSGDS